MSSNKRRVSMTDSQDFKQAVKEIPSLIFEEIRKNNTQSTTPPQRNHSHSSPISAVYTSPIKSKRLMFIGVTVCLITILGFWFVYITDTIRQNKLNLYPTEAFEDSEKKDDLSMLINTFTQMEDKLKGTIKSPSELKLMVAQALIPLLTASSTTSTLPLITTTTIATTTP